MADPLIVGWAHGKFGRAEAPGLEPLIAGVVPDALLHAGIGAEDVDGIYVGVFNNGFSPQAFEAALVGMGLPALAGVPATRVENACATGSAALHAAMDFIAAGRGTIALVVGAEAMTRTPTPRAGEIMLSAAYRAEEGDVAGGFAGIFGGIADRYFQRHGDQSTALAMIAAKNHANGMLNPFGHMQKALDLAFCDTVSDRNPIVAGPLRRTDCALISDGAAALVLAAPEVASGMRRAIRFRARRQANDALALSRRDPTEFAGARAAWAGALAEARVTLDDLDLVETHDCFTIAELLEYEAMGLAPRGQGARVIRDGVTARDGRLPVNPSGGLKAKGHPLGATGVSQHVMAAMQLTAEAGAMQLPDVALAGVFNMGGAAVANYVSILERVA
ncbi:thiolase domain-containing protein [Roseisalinus antarcticus]|uniref:Beta-ketoadipyl-CoA thiolase n=1 Tax=Roseisalinus antarcticus TaxID=254357 RepID=A0A1Y5S1T2_9RHOB|nr:thiolase domain-containing protein [Roseisalinus antarcticus]SLN27767.1 Beta-ketoadipyl-CoA thiolase [Roseisalinus antarcticus]